MAGVTLLAFAAGVLSAFVHKAALDLGGLSLPVGLVAALAAAAALVLLARTVAGSRAAVLVVGAAYGLPVLVLSQLRAEGDLVVAEDVWGLTLLGGAALVVAAGVAVPFSPYDGDRSSGRAGRHPTPPVTSGRP
jgi:hypothetical protein